MKILINFYKNNQDTSEYITILPSKIISVDIYHEENSYSTCKILTIIDKIIDKSILLNAQIIECENNKVIFRGQVQEITPIRSNLYQISLTAKPQNPKNLILKLYQNYIKNLDKLDQNILELFISRHDQESIEKTLQQITSSTIFCDPVTHEIRLSNITDGKRIKLTNILNKFSAKQGKQIPVINLKLNFNWVWNGFYIKDIYQEIAKFFDGKTMSADNLIDKFNKIKQKFNHKNIDIISSKLFKVTNHSLQKKVCDKIFNIHESTLFGEFKIKIHKDIKIYDNFSINIINSKANPKSTHKKITINLNTLSSLKCPNWQPFKQYFEDDTVYIDHQVFKAKEDHISDENFNKNKWIKQDNQISLFSFDEPFFSSDYGKKTIEYAIKIAKSYIDYHNRNTSILFKIPLKNGIFLSTNQIAETDTFPTINGKIVKIHNRLSWQEEFSEILLKTNSNFTLSKSNTVNEKIDINTKSENINGLFVPEEHIINSVNITNNFTKQSEILNATFQSVNEFKKSMNNANTDISFTITPVPSRNSVKNISNAKDIIY